MQRNKALEMLRQLKPQLCEQFGVERLALFGSTARDSATEKSDVDILVSFSGTADSKRYFGALFLLEDTLGCQIDMVTDSEVRPEIKPYILRDIIDV